MITLNTLLLHVENSLIDKMFTGWITSFCFSAIPLKMKFPLRIKNIQAPCKEAEQCRHDDCKVSLCCRFAETAEQRAVPLHKPIGSRAIFLPQHQR